MVEITEIKDEVKEEIAQKVDPNASYSTQLYQYSATPYPAWVFSGLLLATPLITKQPTPTTTSVSSGGFSLFGSSAIRKARVGPSPLSALLFGSALGLGGWIINDGDVESGTGFITAWSTLYLIVNGRSTLNGLRYGKVWPILLTGVAGTNAYIHGKRFFFSSSNN